ncbi:MAG: T9SS type A sorting domain-containing protein, partial [Bacteroidia bacterium]|nr:T9SS type A sorting domain-containing protein [Bacteroidia bacterium]
VVSGQSNLENVSFAPGTSTGYAGGYGELMKSADGGLTWNTLNIPPVSIRCIYAFSPDTVYLGTYDALYRSVSGGLYWERFNLPGFQRINDIRFYDGNNGMVAGDSGYIAVTANGGGLPTPVAGFSLPASSACAGTSITPVNYGDPAWSCQWFINGLPVSTQYAPSLLLASSGTAVIDLVVTSNGLTDTASVTMQVTPLPAVNPFSVVNDTICQGGQGHFYVPASQPMVSYALFDGTVQVGAAQGGTGNTISFTTQNNQTTVKPYRIRAVYANSCGSDTLEVYDSLWIATPAANVSAMLYRDTICTGDTTFMLVYNSEQGWDYYCSNAQFTKVDGTGGTIGIPVGPITSGVTITVYARLKSLNCVKALSGTHPLTYRGTSVSILPGTLQTGQGQTLAVGASSSGFNAWDWDFGPNAVPQTAGGQTPPAPVFPVAGIDTLTLTARLDYTCSKTIRKAVFVYGNLPLSSTIACDLDTFPGTIGTTSYKYCFDDFNNLHETGFNAQSTNFAFIPYVSKFDSAGFRRNYMSFNSTGNNPGAQGLVNGITADRMTNTYFATHYVAPSRFDVQGNYIRNRNAIVKLNEKGSFQWAIETPLADFSDMITLDNRIFAIGINAWNGCAFQTPAGLYQYTPSISNKGEAFLMELNPGGQILGFDAFGSAGPGGVSSPAKFKVKVPVANQYFDYDTLRQNLMARKSPAGDLLIGGLLDATSIGAPVYFNTQVMANTLPVGAPGEKCFFISRYDLSSGFSDVRSLMGGQPEFITDFKENVNGHFVFIGRAKNKLVTSNGTLVFPVQNYEYQVAASFSPAGTLDWLVYADSMSFKGAGINSDGSVTVLAAMSTKFLIVDGLSNPYNVSPVPAVGSYLLRFGALGELLSADRTSSFTAFTLQQDACGNHHVYHSTNSGVQYRVLRTVHTNNAGCGSNCFEAYDPNLRDVALDSVLLSDQSTTGPSVRDLRLKVRSKSLVPVSSLALKYQINNDAVQTLNWNGTLLTGDTLSLLVNGYNFNRSYNRIRTWIDHVNGTSDDYPENDSLIRSQIICSAPLAGVYSVGCDTCYFDHIQASATTLKTCGVSDPVTMVIEPGLYREQVRVDSIPFSSVSDSVVWTSRTANADDVILELGCDYTYYRNPLYLYHAQYCSFEHLTLRNALPKAYDVMQADPAGQSVINMESVHNINISHCKLYGISRSGAVSGNGAILDCYAGYRMRILNNEMEGGELALKMGGSLFQCRNVLFNNNVSRQNNGAQFYNVDSLIVDQNVLTTVGDVYAASLRVNVSDSVRITNNLVSSENWGNEAFSLSCSCNVAAPCLVANNIFSSSPLWLPLAGASFSATNVNVINNSFGHGVEIYSTGGFNFVNNLVRSNGSFAVDMNSPTFINTFNNNRYQSVGTPINFINNSTNYSLAGWRTQTGFDMQSDSVTAAYTTLTDMHLRNPVSMPGIAWPGIGTDIDGDPRPVPPTVGADEYGFNPLIGVVWPGDCDSTKTVDNFDLLPVGLYFNQYSTSRPDDPSTAWAAQPSMFWSKLQASGINMNHVDANGDGWVNLGDTAVVVANFGQSHALANPEPNRLMSGPDLAVVPVGSVFAAGDTVHLKVMAGTGTWPVDRLSAIGFKVNVPPGIIVPGSYKISLANNWLCPDSNCILFQRADEPSGIAAVSLARLDGDQVSAYGELADLSFVVNAAYTGNPTVTIPVSDYRSFEPEATPISHSLVDGVIQVTNTAVAEPYGWDGLALYPNPATNTVNVYFNRRSQQMETMQVEVLDLSGRLVKTFAPVQLQGGKQEIRLDCSDFLDGMYFIHFRSAGYAATLKFMKQGKQ